MIKKAFSLKTDANQAAWEIHQQLDPTEAAVVVFFCSADYDLASLCQALAKLFGDILTIGCTTAGEISPAGYVQNSITAFSLPKRYFRVEARLMSNMQAITSDSAHELVKDMLSKLEQKAVAPVMQNSFALSLLDGMSIREEVVIGALSQALGDIQIVGGSAGDNLHFDNTQIYFQHRFHSNAAVLILVNTLCPFQVFSDHHLAKDQDKLVVTEADPQRRIVHEFNAEPAAIEYCRVTGLNPEALNPKTFALHPLAVQFADQIYVRSIQQVNDDLSLTFFCAIDQGIVLTKMYSTGLVNHTYNFLRAIVAEIGEPELIIGCDCIHRRIEMEEYGLLSEISRLYIQRKVMGFSTYGEQVNRMHINHTFTGIAIGRPA
jgi:hypothetical protein